MVMISEIMDHKGNKYPQFEGLLEMLESVVTADGVSLVIAEDLNEARDRLQETKKLYFQNEIILDEIKNVILEKNKKMRHEKICTEASKAYSMLEDSLRTAEAKLYLKISWTEDDPTRGNLFGLTDEKLSPKHQKKRKIQQALQQYFIPDLEQRLKEKCIDLMKLWDSNTETESDGLALAKAGNLPVLVETELTKISEAQKKFKCEKKNNQGLLLKYQEAVKEYINSLEELMDKHPLDSRVENTKTTVDWLEAKCDAMQLKIKVLQSQVLKDTYNKETVPALKRIRDSLDTAFKESKIELAKLKQTLSVYESIGSGFDSLVKEYARLTAEIDNRKWALSELKRTQGDE